MDVNRRSDEGSEAGAGADAVAGTTADPIPGGRQPLSRRHRRLMGGSLPALGVLLEVGLIILGVLAALAVDEWREGRERERQVAVALESIRAELVENQRLVEDARSHHVRMADTLGAYVAAGERPPMSLLNSGLLQPAPVAAMAWEAARETGIVNHMPYARVVSLSRIYQEQARYRGVAGELISGVYLELLREGSGWLEEHFAHFIFLQTDLRQRETVLAGEYARALQEWDSQ